MTGHDGLKYAGLFDTRQHLGAKHFRQGLMIKQIASFFVAPPPPFLIKRGGGHQEMHMRMEVQPATMRMQHGHRTGGAP